MTDPRITLSRAPGLTNYRQLDRYFNFILKFGSTERGKGLHGHHIHPLKMGGLDNKTNLVYLTPRAHYICHQILFRAFLKNQEAQRAAWLMSHTQEGVKISSIMYDFLKNNYLFSDKTREKISKAGKGRSFSSESRQKISTKNKEVYHSTPKEVLKDRIDRMRATKLGSKRTDTQRDYIVRSLPRGKDHWKLRNISLWERSEEVLEVWLTNGKPGYTKLCKLLGIPKTKSVMSIVKSMI